MKGYLILIGLTLLGLSFIPLLPDPYTHVDLVCFWVWAYREIEELSHGERE